jgi:hypothetical protein
MSRNPFISTFEAEFNKEASRTLVDMSATMKESPKKSTFGTATEDIFVRFYLAICSPIALDVTAAGTSTSHKLRAFCPPWTVMACSSLLYTLHQWTASSAS